MSKTRIYKQLNHNFKELLITILFAIRPLLCPRQCCRFTVSCLDYTQIQIRTSPLWLASWHIFTRLLQCHPWHYDPK